MSAPLLGPENSAATDPQPTPVPGGLAPTRRQVEHAKRERRSALAVWMIPLALILIGLYWRLAVGALPLGLGLISWVLPAAVAAVIAAILWALIVEPNSRGNALGDTHRAEIALDTATVERDEQLVQLGKQTKEHGELCAQSARAELLEADERIIDALEVSHRSLQVAAGVLHVPDVPTVRSGNLMKPTMPHLDRIRGALDTEVGTQQSLAAGLGIAYLPALEEGVSPHLPLAEPADVGPFMDHADPRAVPTFGPSTLGSVTQEAAPVTARPGRRRPWFVLAVVASLAVLVALLWVLLGHGASSVAAGAPSTAPRLVAAHPELPAGLRDGVDFSFLHRSSNDQPIRWSCASPITVRLAGPAPAGASGTMSRAVNALSSASGLPLVQGATLARAITAMGAVPAGEIVFNYLSATQIAAAHLNLTGDVLGEGGPAYGQSDGQIASGWVAIRTDDGVSPASDLGLEVAMHEGAHALGLGHSLQRTAHTEVMEAHADGLSAPSWGPGDRYALKAVGCDLS